MTLYALQIGGYGQKVLHEADSTRVCKLIRVVTDERYLRVTQDSGIILYRRYCWPNTQRTKRKKKEKTKPIIMLYLYYLTVNTLVVFVQ